MGSHSFYTIFEHTADVGIEVRADSREQLFTRSALAMADMMFERAPGGSAESRLIMVVGANPEELLIAWLNELLYIYTVEGLIFSGFSDVELAETTFMARGHGSRYDPDLHSMEMEIKAATYHGVGLERKGDEWTARIIFDV